MTDRIHFADLTVITCPFGLLDADTQQRLRDWPHGLEIFTSLLAWNVAGAYFISNSATYRARPAPLVKPTVDWSQVGPAVNHFATDEDGEVWGYESKPEPFQINWQAREGRAVRYADRLFPSYRRGTVKWSDSLISRPEVEG